MGRSLLGVLEALGAVVDSMDEDCLIVESYEFIERLLRLPGDRASFAWIVDFIS